MANSAKQSDSVKIILSCQNRCFFCLKEVKLEQCDTVEDDLNNVTTVSRENYKNVEESMKSYSLRNIFRFLKIRTGNHFNLQECNDNESGNLLEKLEFMVPVCQDCYVMMEAFTQLHKVMELTRMKLSDSTEKICGVMKNAQSQENRGSEAEEALVRKLREETMEKCGERMKSSLPRVKLTKFCGVNVTKTRTPSGHQANYGSLAESNPSDIEPESPDGVEGEMILCDLEEEEKEEMLDEKDIITIIDQKEYGNHGDDEEKNLGMTSTLKGQEESVEGWVDEEDSDFDEEGLTQNSTLEEGDSAEIVNNVLTSVRIAKGHGSSDIITGSSPNGRFPVKYDRVKCGHCEAVLDNQLSLKKHFVSYHAELFFPKSRAENVTPDQFQRIITDLLFEGFPEPGHSFCPLCGTSVTKYHERHWVNLLKFHLIEEHRSVLTQKLNEIQHNPKLVAQLLVANPYGYSCPCGVYLPNARKLRYHRKYHCKIAGLMNASPHDPLVLAQAEAMMSPNKRKRKSTHEHQTYQTLGPSETPTPPPGFVVMSSVTRMVKCLKCFKNVYLYRLGKHGCYSNDNNIRA